ncbi:MAG TPA: class I SAM-dependent methyltransferase [Acidobacteriaceae bacterium]|jgi:2-polyprenyl-6-hydroxyphenyl methylase/3-demethylubiquinone-9 3-methyltransferase|nr:class I SAM-dependent methyltransferase [Acidobacteriaceae bacterium]
MSDLKDGGTAEDTMDPVVVADPRAAECKVCRGASPLYGVVDFHKSCIEAQGRRLAVSGKPVYYQRCEGCGFVFTTAFDAWDFDAFRRNIYNDDYVVVDPDYVEVRPTGSAGLVAASFPNARSSITILDYGGGSGLMAARLREQGFAASTYDPFSQFDALPGERFDLVTCFEVMEHVPSPEKTVAAMVSLLKHPGAILFSTLVQPANFDQIGLNWWYASPRNGHISLYTTASLAMLFERHGMKVGSFSEGMHIAFGEIPPFAAHLKLPR